MRGGHADRGGVTAVEPVVWVILAVLLIAVPLAALLFTGLWVVKLVQKYKMFSDEEEPAPEDPSEDPREKEREEK